MKNVVPFIFLLALLVSGCTQDEMLRNGTFSSGGRIFTTSFENDESRTYVEDGHLLRWTAGDQISLFDGNTLPLQYQFKGWTGANAGTFYMVSKPEGTGSSLNHNYAVYPYAQDVKVSKEGVLTATLPSKQHYAMNSFGLGDNTMVAVTRNVDDLFLNFKNVGGFLKLQLYGDDITVKSITLTGNNGEKIAGEATLTVGYDDSPVVSMAESSATSITLDCGEKGVKLGTSEEEATEFWIVVPPTTFEKGITVKVRDFENGVFIQTTDKKQIIERNVVKPMAVVKAVMEKENGVVNVAEAGNLKQLLGENFLNITTLKIIGPINGDDVRCLRQMLGGYEYAEKGILTLLDLSEATIVEGGGPYYEETYTSCYTSNDVIGSVMFKECTNLEKMILPAGVTSIDGSAFYNCSSLVSVTIGDSLTKIQNYAFEGCSSLTSVYITDLSAWCNISFGYYSPLYYGAKLYLNNKELTDLIIPADVKQVKKYAFRGCKSFKKVTLGKDVVSIDIQAFENCSSLTTVSIGDGLNHIGQYAFGHCDALTSIEIPDGVTSIDDYAFEDCSSLKFVTISNSVTSMGRGVFQNCAALISVNIGDGLELIPSSCFYDCSSLTTVYIGSGVTVIGQHAFWNCEALADVYCYAINPPNIYSYGFSLNKNKTLHCPKGYRYKYENIWSAYFKEIIEMD